MLLVVNIILIIGHTVIIDAPLDARRLHALGIRGGMAVADAEMHCKQPLVNGWHLHRSQIFSEQIRRPEVRQTQNG